MQSTNKDKGVDQHKCIFGSFTAECLDTGADDLNVQTQRLIRNRDRHKFTKKKKKSSNQNAIHLQLKGIIRYQLTRNIMCQPEVERTKRFTKILITNPPTSKFRANDSRQTQRSSTLRSYNVMWNLFSSMQSTWKESPIIFGVATIILEFH